MRFFLSSFVFSRTIAQKSLSRALSVLFLPKAVGSARFREVRRPDPPRGGDDDDDDDDDDDNVRVY